ncbi:uncharacterized protein LOC124924577 [Impatiens glandulifera]|uniref:uncharacterized protein LOC124924577 n=1 Tax=Impatiens glandulifera TaxID=253017 RepID=UPI001FB0F21F|nr:uncharacterized protein LOC124924577 [Impatiens glandulifera]
MGYAIPLGKIMLHHNINTGPGVLLSSSKIIRSRQLMERKSNRRVSTGSRKKKSASRKPSPVKGRSGSKKDKQPIEFEDPPCETQNEDDSASSSERTASHNTEENESGKGKRPINEEQSASLEHADTGAKSLGEERDHDNDNNQEVAENIVRRIMEEIDLHAYEESEVYCEWFRYRCDKFYKQMLPGLTVGQRFERLMEIEEDVINLTKAKDPNEALERHAIVEPLAEHIRKLTEKYTPGTPKSQLQLLVLELLAVKKGEFIDKVAWHEEVPEQQDTTHSPPHENVDGQNPGDTSPSADQTINITDDRIETPLTDNLESAQVRNSEPAVTEERVKTLIEEFVNDAVKPWKRKIKKAVVQAIKLAETTRDDLGKADERITSVETNYGHADVLYGAHLKRTIALEDTTSKLVDDRSQEETEHRLTKVDEDRGRSSTQAGLTLDRFISLEEKNATLEERNIKLEADFKAFTEQVTELIKAKLAADKAIEEANALAARQVQVALDEETRKKKEAAWSDANIAKVTAKNLALAKSIAAKQAEEANRLKAQQEKYHNFEKIHKKSQAAPSSSAPAT